MNKEQLIKMHEEIQNIQDRCCNCVYFPDCHQDCKHKHGDFFEPKSSLVEAIKKKYNYIEV